MKKIVVVGLLSILAMGCQSEQTKDKSVDVVSEKPKLNADHMRRETVGESASAAIVATETDDAIPEPVRRSVMLRPPKKSPKVEKYTVVVNGVPIHELLFSLARDAKMNIDIDDNIQGTVTLNAINQTLEQILNRIERQADIRYEMIDGNLVVEKDKPFLKTYRFDYLNLSRTAESNINLATQISSTGSSGSDGFGNNSASIISGESEHNIWDALINNIKQILEEGSPIVETTLNKVLEDAVAQESEQETDTSKKTTEEGAEIKATYTTGRTSVIANKESGIIMARATKKQHADIRELIDETSGSVRKQVLIEATVVEVRLNDQHQQGVDWSAIQNSGEFSLEQSLIGTNLAAAPFFSAGVDTTSGDFNITSTVKLLDSFGDTRVLSSPKIMALNNQTAILKVVDNIVYFTVDVDTQVDQGIATTTFETEVNTVPVGFVMSVLPFISKSGEIVLNVRPTLSRILNFKNDPNPDLAAAGVVNEIPEIQVREMESVLRMNSGQVAILGGLMQDSIEDQINEVPGLGQIPLLGSLFRSESQTTSKTELVVFMRPIIIRNPSINDDLWHLKELLPDENILNRDHNYRDFR